MKILMINRAFVTEAYLARTSCYLLYWSQVERVRGEVWEWFSETCSSCVVKTNIDGWMGWEMTARKTRKHLKPKNRDRKELIMSENSDPIWNIVNSIQAYRQTQNHLHNNNSNWILVSYKMQSTYQVNYANGCNSFSLRKHSLLYQVTEFLTILPPRWKCGYSEQWVANFMVILHTEHARGLKLLHKRVSEMDNDPKQLVGLVTKWFRDNQINVFHWPS